MSEATGSTLRGYMIAMIAIALSLLLAMLLRPLIGVYPVPLLLFAVMVSAWYGGRGPGLLATFCSALAIGLSFLPPAAPLMIGLADALRLTLFVVVALLINLFCGARRQAEEALRRSEEFHRVILCSMPDAVFITDQTGAFTYICPTIEAIFGYSADEVRAFGNVNRLLGDRLFDPDELDAGKEITNIECEVVDKAGARHVLIVNAKRVSIGGGTVLYSCRDITRRKQVEDMFRRSLESAADAIVGVDGNGSIVLVNARAERMFGYHRDELIGRPVEVLLPECFRDLPAGCFVNDDPGHNCRKTGVVVEIIAQHKDRSRFPAEISLSPLEADDGLFITTIIRDVTERKRAEEERAQLICEQAARFEAEAANRAKDEFLAMVSHELRAPLNAVLGWAKLLRTGRLDETSKAHALKTIERSARTQAQLIEDLMDVSRIVAGRLRLDVCLVDLASVIEAALDAVSPSATAKAIQFRVALDPEVGPISGDPRRLEQIVWNLLSNAVKFTPPGGCVDVRLERTDPHVRITVSDTGNGIATDFLPYVFDRFRQGDSGTQERKGLGLGLTIVRHLVELHRGTVGAESRGEGQGATFTVNLPQPRVAAVAGLASRKGRGF